MAFLELWNRFSSERSETRTQVGEIFERYYSGGGGLIGYVLENPVGDYTVPVYNAWSSSLNDTRFQVGSERLPGYDGDISFLGHIYKPPRNGEQPRFGTAALYRAYNPARKDSRTQVGNAFEPGYENPELLGYVYVERPVLKPFGRARKCLALFANRGEEQDPTNGGRRVEQPFDLSKDQLSTHLIVDIDLLVSSIAMVLAPPSSRISALSKVGFQLKTMNERQQFRYKMRLDDGVYVVLKCKLIGRFHREVPSLAIRLT